VSLAEIFNDAGGWGTVVAILLPTLAFGGRRASELYTRYRLLGFGSRRLDVILPASVPLSDERAGITRPTTGMGSVRAFGYIARAIGRYYRKLPLVVQFSSAIAGRLDADVVSIGGPGSNLVTAEILRSLALKAEAVFFNESTRSVRAPGLSISDYDLGVVGGYPTRDLGLLLICANPFADGRGRAIICCGLTSYGTAGTAQWFFEDVLRPARFWPAGHSIRPRRLGKDESFVALIEVSVANGTIMGTRTLLAQRISISNKALDPESAHVGDD
jgi:hypothetical protein